MPTTPGASLADLAALTGDQIFSAELAGGRLRLSIHAGAPLGLPEQPVAAGEVLLAALDGGDRDRIAAALSLPAAPIDLELPARLASGPVRRLRLRAPPGEGGRRVGTLIDVTGERQVERALRILHAATGAATGQPALEALVRSMAEAVGARWAFITGFLPGRADRLRTQAVWRGDRVVEGFEYDLAGMPCERVVAGEPIQVVAGVTRLFPRAPLLAHLGIESYLGVPVPGPDGRPRGTLVALDERQLSPVQDAASIFGVFAARAAAELGRLAAEAELSASEARFRQIVTSCVEGVVVNDVDGRISYVNQQFAAMLGHPGPEALLGRRWVELGVGPRAAEVAAEALGGRRRGESSQYDLRARRADGSACWLQVAGAPLLDGEGRFAGSIGLVRDVTEQRALDEQVREAQRLESLGLLAGGIAHDFNNLLVGIVANAGFAIGELPAGSDQVRGALEDLRASARQAADLTRQLLAYSGRGTFQIRPVGLGRVVEEMARLAGPSLPRGARVELELDPATPPVEGDAGQLGQLVVNLLTNAGDALGGRPGRIVVRLRAAELEGRELARFTAGEALPGGRYALLQVDDDGKGMEEATLPRIFEPFFSTRGAGRGLGLAAVLGILRGHRGAVRVESTPGEGTRFIVALPVAPAEAAGAGGEDRPLGAGDRDPDDAVAAPAADPERPGGRAGQDPPRRDVEEDGGRGPPIALLVADDEPVVRRAARRALERAGFEVVEAGDGAEALERFRAEPDRFGCVLLDLTMPGIGGEEALARIRELRRAVPAVLTSGFNERDGAPVVDGPPVRFLPKPFGPLDLVEAIRDALGPAAGG